MFAGSYTQLFDSWLERLTRERAYKLYCAVRRNDLDKVDYLIKCDKKLQRISSKDLANIFESTYKDVTTDLDGNNRKFIRQQLLVQLILPRLENFKNLDHPVKVLLEYNDFHLLEHITLKNLIDVNACINGLSLLHRVIVLSHSYCYVQKSANEADECTCFSAYGQFVELLLEKGADVNVLDATGNNALQHLLNKHIRCSKKIEFADLLYKHGIDVNQCNERGESPLQIAIYHVNLPMVRWLANHVANKDVLRKNFDYMLGDLTEVFQNEPFVYELIVLGVLNVDDRILQGTSTALHAAVEYTLYSYDYTETCYTLFDFGARFDAKDDDGDTVFFCICWKSTCVEVVKAFVAEMARIKFDGDAGVLATTCDLSSDFEDLDHFYPYLKVYYVECMRELQNLSKIILLGDLTVYAILSRDIFQLPMHPAITQVEEWFRNFDSKKCPTIRIYRKRIQHKLKNVRRIRMLYDRVLDRLHEALEDVFPDVVLRNIARYLLRLELPCVIDTI